MTRWIKCKAYRVLMKFAHRFKWHYCEICHPDGDTLHWCHWCGLRWVEPKQVKSPLTK
jgi:hypothetical protein